MLQSGNSVGMKIGEPVMYDENSESARTNSPAESVPNGSTSSNENRFNNSSSSRMQNGTNLAFTKWPCDH